MSKILIVGGGVAGLFCAYELLNSSSNEVVLIDMGMKANDRDGVDVFGIGGAGGFFDGKQHYSSVLSHTKCSHIVEAAVYEECLRYVEDIFTRFGATVDFYPRDENLATNLIKEAKNNGVTLYYRKIRHLGTDISRRVTKEMESYLDNAGVSFVTQTRIVDLYFDSEKLKGVVTDNGSVIMGDIVVIVPGRIGSLWLQGLVAKYGIKTHHQPIEIGGRLEFPAQILKKHADIFYDPIFVIKTPTYGDKVRSFCCCPNGQVVIEPHPDYITINGASNSQYNSPNSNFAFVVEVSPESIGQNTTRFAISLAQFLLSIYDGYPVLQRLEDFFLGKITNKSSLQNTRLKPSLEKVAFGDVSSLLPHRIVVALQEGLISLEKILPGVSHPDNLFYIPEVKLRASQVEVNNNWETSVKGLFVGGDGAGLGGSITSAAVNGVILARKLGT